MIKVPLTCQPPRSSSCSLRTFIPYTPSTHPHHILCLKKQHQQQQLNHRIYDPSVVYIQQLTTTELQHGSHHRHQQANRTVNTATTAHRRSTPMPRHRPSSIEIIAFTQHNRSSILSILNSSTFILFAIVFAALLPAVSAQHITQNDPYTSYPTTTTFGSVYGSKWSWETGYTDNKSRPLLIFPELDLSPGIHTTTTCDGVRYPFGIVQIDGSRRTRRRSGKTSRHRDHRRVHYDTDSRRSIRDVCRFDIGVPVTVSASFIESPMLTVHLKVFLRRPDSTSGPEYEWKPHSAETR